MKKILLSLLAIVSCNFGVWASETAMDVTMPNPKAFGHFLDDKKLITDCLGATNDAQLHFYWTTGRTLSDNLSYQPMTQVSIGGERYGKKFFPYVEALLKHSPDKLSIKFICDTTTIESNQTHIQSLKSQYGNRFELLPVEGVIENLLKEFSTKEQVYKINVFFRNATQGSPVLASDVYRIIGMIYGQGHQVGLKGALRTYCDIDAFCYGMETENHVDLIESLFRYVPKSPFYFGRSHKNNDVIKICIEDLFLYRELCVRQLNNLVTDKIAIPKFNNKSVVTHFSDLHDMIRKCEVDPVYCSQVVLNLPVPIYNLISEVVQATGPSFLYDVNITMNLLYPSETVGAWSTPEESLDHRRESNNIHPPSILDWGMADSTPEEQRVCDEFITVCEQYRKCLGAYYYGKKFGEKHPFNLVLKAYLLNHCPYRSDSFKELLRVNFACHNQDIPQKYELVLEESISCFDGGIDEGIGKDEYEEGVLYLEIRKEGGLKYKAKSDGRLIDGIFDVNTADFKQSSWRKSRKFLRDKKDEILELASKNGLTLPAKKGKTREEHKNISYKRATTTVWGYYMALMNVLKELELEVSPLSLTDFDF